MINFRALKSVWIRLEDASFFFVLIVDLTNSLSSSFFSLRATDSWWNNLTWHEAKGLQGCQVSSGKFSAFSTQLSLSQSFTWDSVTFLKRKRGAKNRGKGKKAERSKTREDFFLALASRVVDHRLSLRYNFLSRLFSLPFWFQYILLNVQIFAIFFLVLTNFVSLFYRWSSATFRRKKRRQQIWFSQKKLVNFFQAYWKIFSFLSWPKCNFR